MAIVVELLTSALQGIPLAVKKFSNAQTATDVSPKSLGAQKKVTLTENKTIPRDLGKMLV